MKKYFITIILLSLTIILTGCSEELFIFQNGNGTTIISNECPPNAICEVLTYTNNIANINITENNNTPIMYQYE